MFHADDSQKGYKNIRRTCSSSHASRVQAANWNVSVLVAGCKWTDAGALRAINLIKEKRCGKIKGQTVADGSTQRLYTSRAETASPTIGLEALYASLMIDAHEGRAVQTFDVPGAYLQTPMPENKIVHMKFEGEFVDILCESDESFRKHITYEKGKKVLYTRVHKAIYGLIESALLW